MKRNKIPAEGKERRKGRRALLWIGCGAAVLLLILLAVYMTGAVGRTVGETVKLKDVTDFYYTYSTSTDPPLLPAVSLLPGGERDARLLS